MYSWKNFSLPANENNCVDIKERYRDTINELAFKSL